MEWVNNKINSVDHKNCHLDKILSQYRTYLTIQLYCKYKIIKINVYGNHTNLACTAFFFKS